MNKLSNELKIGLVVLASIFIAYIGFRIMKDEPFFSSTNMVYTKYQTVDGLIKGSNVFLNGFKVGTVKEMSFLPGGDSTLVAISITEPITIPVGSKARLATPDFIGTGTIDIEKSDNQEMIEWGDYIEGVQKEGLLESFTEKASSMSDSVAISINKINSILTKAESIDETEINSTISSFRETGETIQEIITKRQADIDSMIIDARKTMGSLSELSDGSKGNIESTLANLEKFSNELDALSAELQASSESINSILSKIDIGEGSLGKMVNDPSLYNNLDSLTVNLNELIKGIQEDPKRYLKHMRLVEIF